MTCPYCSHRGDRLLVSDIQRIVAFHFNVPVLTMTEHRANRETARPRQVAMYLARKLTKMSLPEIGRRFNRDHSTVIHARKAIEAEREKDGEFDQDIARLEKALAPQSDRHQRILDQISDPVARKILIVRWGVDGEIPPEQAEALIQQNQLEAV